MLRIISVYGLTSKRSKTGQERENYSVILRARIGAAPFF